MDFEAYLEEVKNLPFPDTEYEYVEMEVEARNAQIGDQLVNHGLAKVADVKVGTKWTEASARGGKRLFRTLNDITITVRRKNQTAESRAADLRVAVTQTLARNLSNTHSEDLVGPTQYRLNHDIDCGYAIRYDTVDDLLHLDARRVLDLQMRAAIEFQLNQVEFTGDLFDAYHLYIEDLKNTIATGYFGNRSSNQMSNLMEDIKVEAMRDIVREAKWMR